MKDDYVHYVPEFNTITVMSKKRTRYYAECFIKPSEMKPKDKKRFTKMIFLFVDDLGFR